MEEKTRYSDEELEEFRKQLGVSEAAPTTPDMLFTVETVSCLGACGLAPVCTVNDVVHPAMTPEKARELMKDWQEKKASRKKKHFFAGKYNIMRENALIKEKKTIFYSPRLNLLGFSGSN